MPSLEIASFTDVSIFGNHGCSQRCTYKRASDGCPAESRRGLCLGAISFHPALDGEPDPEVSEFMGLRFGVGNGTVQFITCTTDSAFASTVAVLEKSYRSEP